MNVSFRYKISNNNLVRKKGLNCLDSNRTVKQMEVADMHILTLIIIFVIASIGAACKTFLILQVREDEAGLHI